ncbi:MAG: hypothetical protein C4320_02445, partial [Armatimonadota bacterium]
MNPTPIFRARTTPPARRNDAPGGENADGTSPSPNREGGNREGGSREAGNREGGNRDWGNREGGNQNRGYNRDGGGAFGN